jgi:putative ABC transport system permease protein
MIKDFVKLAYLSVKNRKVRSWLTMIGVIIGVAAVVSLIGLGEGLRAGVLGQFSFLSTDILTVQASGLQTGPPGSGVVNALKEDYVDDIEDINGVDMAIGRIIEDAKIEFNGKADFTFAGTMPDGEKRQEIERIAQFEIDKGRSLKDGDTFKVFLGHNYGEDEIFGRAVEVRDKVKIQGKDFEVVGILKKKGSFIVDNVIGMNEDVFKDLFNIDDEVDVIVVKVENLDEMGLVKERIENYLRKERDVDEGEEDFTVESPEQALEDLDSTLFAVQLLVYIIALVSIIVGGLGIMNTMYTSVLERTRQIGVMKSIGATNGNIFTLFLIEAGSLGLVGGAIGAVLGIIIAQGLAAIGRLALNSDLIQVQIKIPVIIGALLFSFIVGTVAGLLPSVQASKLKPVDALRY